MIVMSGAYIGLTWQPRRTILGLWISEALAQAGGDGFLAEGESVSGGYYLVEDGIEFG